MASGGSSSRAGGSGSRSFDFGTDDILCSYDDFSTRDPSIGKRSDPPGKDLHESRMGKPLVNIYEQEDYSREGVISSVEKCMKKYADNLLRSLDGISGRLSQLEITCHKLEGSICELRADFIQDQSEKDVKFKSLEKHLLEVHRSVQILRDKQELAETHKELAKLQLAQKESTENEKSAARSVSEPKTLDDKSNTANQQMSLTGQTATSAVVPAAPSQPIQPYVGNQPPGSSNIQQDQIMLNQAGNYYSPHQTLPHEQRSQPVQSELHYMQPRPQLHDRPLQAPLQQPQLVNQNQPPFAQYQQHIPPQTDQQLPPQLISQAQIRPQAPSSYPPYSSQPVNPGPETYPTSMPMQQVPNPTIPPPVIRPESLPFGYGGTGSSAPQPAPLHHNIQQPIPPPGGQNSFGPQLGKSGYISSAPYPPQPQNVPGYNSAYSYPPPSSHPGARNQQMPPGSGSAHHYDSQMIRNHPYGEMIDKAVGMGFDKNQVINVVQRMVDSGQPMDFNSLLDRLNGHNAGGASPRTW